ncbi:unnamed protein product, partial [Rotaria sp. Silwood1]
RQAKTTTEVLITNARGNNQRQVNVSNLEIEQEINILNDTEQNDTEQNNVEQSSTREQKNHWAKEVANITHTREAKTNLALCEKKVSHFTSACFDANNFITRNMRELSATVIANRTHDLILDYIKEATKGLSKMSINRIRRAVIEKDEWDALKAFEVVASEQQKIYAKTFCKSALKAYKKKKKNIDLVAAHILYDIIPKILPQYDAFNLPMDENSLPSEQIQENRESIHKLSRDLRLQVTQLYLKIVQEEFEFQKERLEKLLEDF